MLRQRDLAHEAGGATDFPQQRAILHRIGADFVHPNGHQLTARAALPRIRRGPRAALLTWHAPQGFAGELVECFEERFLVVVILNANAPAVQHGRGAGGPAIAHRIARPAALPELVAIPVAAKQADVRKVGIHALAIRHRRFRGEGIARMPHLRRDALVCLELPKDLARLEVETVKHPAVHLARANVSARIAAHMWRGQFPFTHCRGHENPIAPHNRRRPAPARHLHLPHHIFRVAPRLRQRRPLAESVRCRAAKLRPVLRLTPRHEHGCEDGGHEPEGRSHGGQPDAVQINEARLPNLRVASILAVIAGPRRRSGQGGSSSAATWPPIRM